MNQATQDFIRQHQDDDVRQLAFLGSKYPEVDMPFALDQSCLLYTSPSPRDS